jgi:hypothetical protein
MLVMALDHYGAIIKPLRYRQEMTDIKGICAVFIVWRVGFISRFNGNLGCHMARQFHLHR